MYKSSFYLESICSNTQSLSNQYRNSSGNPMSFGDFQGMMMFWYNLQRNGTGLWRTEHGACPVLLGSKWGTLCLIYRWKPRFVMMPTLFSLVAPEVVITTSCATRAWWRHQMETFSAILAICAGNSPVTGEFPTQSPVTRSFGVVFDLRLKKRLRKQSWGWWFETPSHPSWRHCNRQQSWHRDNSRFSVEVAYYLKDIGRVLFKCKGWCCGKHF